MDRKTIKIGVLNYQGCLQSAAFGLQEMFVLANRLFTEQKLAVEFQCELLTTDVLPEMAYAVLLIPPSGPTHAYLQEDKSITAWLLEQYQQGCVLASACAGAFILARTGLLNKRSCTTHWGLETSFREHFPQAELKTEAILLNHGDIMTAGGMMSWLDLGFEVVTQFSTLSVLRQLGRILVIDTGPREQRFYRTFKPNFQHGDETIVSVQQYLGSHFYLAIGMNELAQRACLSERTLQRRFLKATGLGANQYLQRLRVQKACDLLESSQQTFETIAYDVGYQDAGSFRKLFVREMGLSPKVFREKFRTLI
ncbi:GlxA family transcriptional regulator [Marinomonas transparens]|uniref:Helix-turn-helix domain-containing protein n=1 Tax=Marinomonas transparens TaxID=2795388 RepID=A0A934N4Q3_9GAMM|nr:helix-turn-helix domain-containing protein [Marinomonas transparens]MBJ7536246.1 helix-turn-helix domain-containing protein [Marinomonas transparens]